MKTKIKIEILGEGFHPVITAKINGKNCRMLIDTGASKTVFDKKRIMGFIKKTRLKKQDDISYGAGGEITTYEVSANIKIASLLIKNYMGVAMDISNINGIYEACKLKPIDVVLGSDILLEHKFVIDYRNKELRIDKK